MVMSWSICHGLQAGEGTGTLFHITVPVVFEGMGVPEHIFHILEQFDKTIHVL